MTAETAFVQTRRMVVEVYEDGWQPCDVADAGVFFEGFCPRHLAAFQPDGCQMIPKGFDGKVAPNCPVCDLHWRGAIVASGPGEKS